MAVLSMLGRLLLWLLGIVLVLLVILLFVPVSVWLDYSGGVFSVRVGMLGLKGKVWPQKPLTEEQKKRKAEKAAAKKAKKEAKRAKKPTPPAKAQASDETKEPKAKLTLEAVCTMVGAAGRLMRGVFGALRFRHVRLRLPVSGKDAADTAVKYGRAQAWLSPVLGFLNQFFWLDIEEMHLDPDFTGTLRGTEHFSCQITARLIIMLVAGAAFVYTLFKEKIIDIFI